LSSRNERRDLRLESPPHIRQSTSSRPERSAAERPLYFVFAVAVAVAVAVVVVVVVVAVALASGYAKASALALYGQPTNRGFSPWGKLNM